MTRLSPLPSLLSIATVAPATAARTVRSPGSGTAAVFADLVAPALNGAAAPSFATATKGAPVAVAMPGMSPPTPVATAAAVLDAVPMPAATAAAEAAAAPAAVATVVADQVTDAPILPPVPVRRWQADAGTGKALPTAALPPTSIIIPTPAAGPALVSSPTTDVPGLATDEDMVPRAVKATTDDASPADAEPAIAERPAAPVASRVAPSTAKRPPVPAPLPTFHAETSDLATGSPVATVDAATALSPDAATLEPVANVATGQDRTAEPNTVEPPTIAAAVTVPTIPPVSNPPLPIAPTPVKGDAATTLAATVLRSADDPPPALAASVTATSTPGATRTISVAAEDTPALPDSVAPQGSASSPARTSPVARHHSHASSVASRRDDSGPQDATVDTPATPDAVTANILPPPVDAPAMVLAATPAVPTPTVAPESAAKVLTATAVPSSADVQGMPIALTGQTVPPSGDDPDAGVRPTSPAVRPAVGASVSMPPIEPAASSSSGFVAADVSQPSLAPAAPSLSPAPAPTSVLAPQALATPTILATAPGVIVPSGVAAPALAAMGSTGLAPAIVPPRVTGAIRSTAAPARTDTPTQAVTVAAAAVLPDVAPASGAAGRVFAAALHAASSPTARTTDGATPPSTDAPDPMVAALLASAAPTRTSDAAAITGTATTAIDLHHAAWPTKMAEQIEALRDGADATSTRLRISPDALGPVDLQVRRDGDRVHVHFAASNAETRALIADAQPQLAAAAADRGLKLGQTSVGAGGTSGGGAQSWSGDQSGRQSAAAPRAARPATATTVTADDADSDTRIA